MAGAVPWPILNFHPAEVCVPQICVLVLSVVGYEPHGQLTSIRLKMKTDCGYTIR